MSKCVNPASIKDKLFQKIINQPESDSSKNALYNLNKYLGIGEYISFDGNGGDAERDYKRDMNKDLQDVKITKPTGPKGDNMR